MPILPPDSPPRMRCQKCHTQHFSATPTDQRSGHARKGRRRLQAGGGWLSTGLVSRQRCSGARRLVYGESPLKPLLGVSSSTYTSASIMSPASSPPHRPPAPLPSACPRLIEVPPRYAIHPWALAPPAPIMGLQHVPRRIVHRNFPVLVATTSQGQHTWFLCLMKDSGAVQRWCRDGAVTVR